MKELKEIIWEFELSSGASEIDYEDDTIQEMLERLSKKDLKSVKDAFILLTSFYSAEL